MPFYYYSPVMLEPFPSSDKSANQRQGPAGKQQKQGGVLSGAWNVLLQAFTVDDVFTRKIK